MCVFGYMVPFGTFSVSCSPRSQCSLLCAHVFLFPQSYSERQKKISIELGFYKVMNRLEFIQV